MSTKIFVSSTVRRFSIPISISHFSKVENRFYFWISMTKFLVAKFMKPSTLFESALYGWRNSWHSCMCWNYINAALQFLYLRVWLRTLSTYFQLFLYIKITLIMWMPQRHILRYIQGDQTLEWQADVSETETCFCYGLGPGNFHRREDSSHLLRWISMCIWICWRTSWFPGLMKH